MYDTIKAWLETPEKETFESVLSDYRSMANTITGDHRQYGSLKNLKVRTTERGIVVEGSLPKYLYGNNLPALTRRATQEAIESISDALHQSFKSASLCRIDLAQNMIMKRPVIDYTSRLLSAPFLKRTDIADRETVNFQNKLRILSFYDKEKEYRKKTEIELPAMYKGKNILRYEARYLSRIGNQFGRHTVTAENLYDEIFYMKALDKWQGEYFLIQKIRKERAVNVKGQREYLQSLAFYGLQNIGGVDVALDLINGARLRGEIDKKTGYRLRHLTREIAQARPVTGEPAEDCIEELDNKIKQAAACYR